MDSPMLVRGRIAARSGEGKVEAQEGEGPQARLSIVFPQIGKKKIQARFVRPVAPASPAAPSE